MEEFKRFGFITTNSIRQSLLRGVIQFHFIQKKALKLIFAIPDHPWSDDGAAVRISITVGEVGKENFQQQISRFGTVVKEGEGHTPEDEAEKIEVEIQNVEQIFSDLRYGSDLTSTSVLTANCDICNLGIALHGQGFVVPDAIAQSWINGDSKLASIVKPTQNGRDTMGKPRNQFVIDFYGFTEAQAMQFSLPYQWILERVLPTRRVNNRPSYRENWWIFGEPRPLLRKTLEGLSRYIYTPMVAKHRVFLFLNHHVIPDQKIVCFSLEDAYFLGLLSSKVHLVWALATGGTLEDRPSYVKTKCFDPFPFPDPTEPQKQKIRDLGDRLDAHRKRIQAAHPEVTITAMYNLLEKLRKGEPLDDKDKAFNQKALVSTLKQIHDELDTAVFDAYGWPADSTDEQILENLVTLNAQRAAEERNGHIRWLRPDYQNPNATPQPQTAQGELAGIIPTETPIPTPATQQKWPKDFKDQIAAIRDLLRTQGGEWNIDTIAAQFKNANRSKVKIQDAIEALETLGLVTQHTENHKTTWYFTDHQKTA